MSTVHLIVFFVVIVGCLSQRSPYAGTQPIGYPKIEVTTTSTTKGSGPNALGNRFGETTTQRLPIEALGDRELVNHLSQLPEGSRPFWLLNWQKLEENRRGPQTFDQSPNIFAHQFIPPQQNLQPNRF